MKLLDPRSPPTRLSIESKCAQPHGLDLVRRTTLVVEVRNTPFSDQRAIRWRVRERMPRPRGGRIDATGLCMQLADESTGRWWASVVGVMLSEAW